VPYLKVQDLFSLNGKSAIVTGGSMGIGLTIAEALAEAGANLTICSRNLARCEKSAEQIRKLGTTVLALKTDITDPKEVEHMVAKTYAEFGRIDILVNNAGIAWAAPPEKMALDDWKRVLETNLTGAFICSQSVGKRMIEDKGGVIINVTSVAAHSGIDEGILDAISYNSSKGALISFTKDLAIKWAKYGIRVNALALGFFPTHLTEWVIEHRKDKIIGRVPMRRLGAPEDVKGAALFLASNASSYMTGHVLTVDGGMSSYM
jgi:NAD(P)-dependent dehydrogenase (short-subunit alcohol dehydrogenase family)